jgi:dihydroorotate dehydrogenase
MPPLLPYSVVRALLFRLDAERAHLIVFRLLRVFETMLEPTGARQLSFTPALRQEVLDRCFPNPIGLAAGLDKNAELPHVWPAMGFGFAELGTITAKEQPGNPRPRIFRLPEHHAIVNRMGFNNDGAEKVARRLNRHLSRRPVSVPLGINIGKSRITPLQDAVSDYLASLRALFPYADYFVLNVSSPNTPGLRNLQSEARLELLLKAVQEENSALAQTCGGRTVPVLVKLAPDLNDDALRSIVEVAKRCRVAGLIATNTTLQRPDLSRSDIRTTEAGGLSGAPLRKLSTNIVRNLFRLTEGRVPIIGVGGIFTAEDAYEKICAGASLVQVYTGLIYCGPSLPRILCTGLRDLLHRDGIDHIADAVGRNA